ncbi:VanW family protein [[Clostridium] cellulosi]
MKKHLKSSIAFILLTLFVLSCASAAAPSKGTSSGNENTEFDPFMKKTLESGPTTEVPWENDPAFLAAKEKYDCPILMAAYKTVLHDPLPGEEFNVHLAAKYICGCVVEPNKVFSQNNTAGPYTKERGYQSGPTYKGTEVSETVGGGVCKIASTLFNTAILSNLKIVERHTHSMPVPYVPYGQDATVYYGAKDFKFMNNTSSPVLIWAKGIDNILYIGFYGKTKPPKVEWKHEVISVTKAPVYTKKNPNLPPNTEKITHEGMDGAVINSWIILTYPDGKTVKKAMGKSYYSPLPYIKEISG